MAAKVDPILTMPLAILFNVTANLLLKYGMSHAADRPDPTQWTAMFWGMATNPSIVGGIACFGLAFVFYAMTLSGLQLSIAYPIMTSVGYVLVIAASLMWLGESLEPRQFVGVVLILGGLLLVNR